MRNDGKVRPTATERFPKRIVALGGGTGMPAVLAGLRKCISAEHAPDLTAVVTMSDDGGSSGRLRRSRGMPPPGDVRNCLLALSPEQDLMTALFQHRYDGGEELGGHNLGNLILTALAEQTGSFLRAVEVSSRVLRTVGRILPVTLEDVTLEATLEDGSRIVGESAIGACRSRIDRVSLSPGSATASPGVIEAIIDADLIVYGPGSLFTSVVPNLILDEIDAALQHTHAVRVFVGNLVGEHGEASGLQHVDHLHVIERHARGPVVDAMLVHEGPIDPAVEKRYGKEGATLLAPPEQVIPGVAVFKRPLVGPGPKLRHEPLATAAGLIDAWRELTAVSRRTSESPSRSKAS